MTDPTDDQVRALLDEMTREVICGELDKALAERIGRALLDARAELDTTQTQVGDWIVRADEANVKVEKLEAELARVRADTELAVALVVEQCADEVRGSNLGLDINDIADDVRALAPADGLAMVQELRAEMDTLAAENASLKARGAGARNAAMLDCVRIVAEERNKQEPGPLFKVLNEAMGKIEDARFAPTKTESPGELAETLRTISMAQSLSVAQQTALKLIKDLGGQND